MSNLALYYLMPQPPGFAVFGEKGWRAYLQQMRFGRASNDPHLGTGLCVNDANQVFVQVRNNWARRRGRQQSLNKVRVA